MRSPSSAIFSILPFPRHAPAISLSIAASLLAGCASLPSSGPTASQVVHRANDSRNELQFKIVQLDTASVERLNADQAQRTSSATSLVSLAEPLQRVALGAGDVLNISIYEVGVGLFGGGSGTATGGGFDPSARGEKFPNIVIDEQGNIRLPYIGRIAAAGMTPDQLEAQINRRLARKSQDPQAVVTVAKNVSSSYFVLGDANRPGRYDLTYGRERLLDAIASAGGASASAEDTLVQLERRGQVVEQRLGSIRAGSPDDVALSPGDRIQLIKRPRSYTVFGATTRVSQVTFETGAVSLAEALARVQGPNDAAADPTAIFIFRYDNMIDQKSNDKPVIYRLNLLDPASYFLSQRFTMQDKDVIYIANAAANQPAKLVGILNQLFSPFVTLRAVTNNP